MESINNLRRDYRKYLDKKLGKESQPFSFLYLEEAFRSAEKLHKDYDLGIELANDGLALRYIFHLYGLPTKAVKLGRKGLGATWNPLEELNEKDIRNKKILVFDNDVVLGRTVGRTQRELNKYSPQFIDLILNYEVTGYAIKYLKRIINNPKLPSIEELLRRKGYDLIRIKEVKDGLEVDYISNFYNDFPQRFRDCHIETLKLRDDFLVGLETRRNVPKEVRRVFTLQKDFSINGEHPKLINLLENE